MQGESEGGGGKTSMKRGYSPILCYSSGQGALTLFYPSPATASSGHCGAVAMEMWVRVLMCEHGVDLELAAECKQLRPEPAVNSS